MTEIRAAAPSAALQRLFEQQAARNHQLLKQTPTLGGEIRSEVLPFAVDLKAPALPDDAERALAALEKTAARIAIESLISLAKVNDIDHLGGGLELIGPLLMTLGAVDYRGTQFSIEHGHTSIGYYSALSALGFLPRERVIEQFRRSLDIAGHVLWVPGGTPIGSGRLGITVPVTAGWSLGLRAGHGDDAFVICHCGDAGWISGQALNGFIGASLHRAPMTLVMHRNGIQLSGTTARIMDKDPRPIVKSLGIEVIELASLHERRELFKAYAHAYSLARSGKPSLIYPVGYDKATVRDFAARYGIVARSRALLREAQGRDRYAGADSGIAHELPRSARDARVPLLRQRAARRRSASRRRHEGTRSRRGARQSDAAGGRRRTGRARSPAAAAEADGRFNRAAANPDRQTSSSSPADVAGDRVAGHRQMGDGASGLRGCVCGCRKEISRRSVSSCRAISIPRHAWARPPRSCRPGTRSR